ncbi:hypothetical protein TrLO_g9430 [Triparma laevis f. longispina]|uniref:Uncharacterized protein n=1 Tax=Triparma laevis f. longispina TaxID=1714387 RepID=A0A9W6ZF66_9STRA|nr:hypothetical protein TrLO_g9430 [Triparma laevis f. longispina]
MSTGQQKAKAQSKAAQQERESAAAAKKQARKDQVWNQGANVKAAEKSSTEKQKAEEKAKAQAEKNAIIAAEGSSNLGTGGGGPIIKRCKDCKQMYNANSKKGCQNCVDLLFGGGVKPKKGRGSKK